MRIPKVYRMFLSKGVPTTRIFPTKRFIVKEDPGHGHQALKSRDNTTDKIQFLNMGFPSGNNEFIQFLLEAGCIIIGIYLIGKSLPYINDWLIDVGIAMHNRSHPKIEAFVEAELARMKLEMEEKNLINQLRIRNDDDENMRLINDTLK